MPNCDGCGKPCGIDAARRGDYDRAYTFNCPKCDREYCGVCLKDESGYNADGDCVGDPPRMVDASSMTQCRKCDEEDKRHLKHCGYWYGEPCFCNPDVTEIVDRANDKEMGL